MKALVLQGFCHGAQAFRALGVARTHIMGEADLMGEEKRCHSVKALIGREQIRSVAVNQPCRQVWLQAHTLSFCAVKHLLIT